MVDDASHYRWLAAAYARGALGRPALDDDAALAAAGDADLRLHRFKRTAGLPRVRAVDAGARRVVVDGVRGHLVAVAHR